MSVFIFELNKKGSVRRLVYCFSLFLYFITFKSHFFIELKEVFSDKELNASLPLFSQQSSCFQEFRQHILGLVKKI